MSDPTMTAIDILMHDLGEAENTLEAIQQTLEPKRENQNMDAYAEMARLEKAITALETERAKDKFLDEAKRQGIAADDAQSLLDIAMYRNGGSLPADVAGALQSARTDTLAGPSRSTPAAPQKQTMAQAAFNQLARKASLSEADRQAYADAYEAVKKREIELVDDDA